ncbi:MAG: hypothetical protein ACREV5_09815 [Steroidobacter sp.]
MFIVWAGALFPLLGVACESGDRHTCMEQFRTLVSHRTEAIETAFGDFFGTLPAEIQIKFVSSRDQQYGQLNGRETYDQKRRVLVFPRRVLGAKTPNPLRWASYYWPYYQNERNHLEFPVIEVIDNLLWSAYLQEAAKARGLTWPHKECVSADVEERLPCEMLIKGIAEHVKTLRGPMFNVNRIDRIWPEDFDEFKRRVWRKSDQEYLDVQRYGGILLAEPLVSEFGVLRAIAYMAQTPFHVEGNNLRISALRYQQRAREALSAANASTPLDSGRLAVQATLPEQL